MEKVTQKVAEFIVNTRYDQIPRDVLEVVKLHILDTIGCVFAGSHEQSVNLITRHITSLSNEGDSTILPFGIKTSPTYAAFANGVIGHTLDYDDYEVPSMAHPSVTVLPAVFALGEKIRANGADCMAAYLAGMEVISKTGNGINPNHYDKGWHSTGTLGPLGAAAATSNLLKLDVEKTRSALGIAASMASGMRGNFGTMTKPFHAGHASRNGVEAALLASIGFTANRNMLENKLGYCSLFTEQKRFDLRKIVTGLGSPFSLFSPGVGKKPYPSCGATHSYLDGILDMIRRYDINAEDIESVHCGISYRHPTMLIYSNPKTGLEGKFSLEFCLALALTDRSVRLEGFTDSKVREPRIQNLMKRISKEVTKEADSLGTYYPKARTEVKMKDGKMYSSTIEKRKGSPANPLTAQEVKEKFQDCTSLAISEEHAGCITDAVMELENIDDIGRLIKMIVKK